MACLKPMMAYVKDSPNANGKFELTWNAREADTRRPPVFVPCGGCIKCKLEYARTWAVRCMHEASLYDDNCFVTLTYNDDHKPVDGKLKSDDFVRFMKRLRRKVAPLLGVSCFRNCDTGKENILRKWLPFGVRYFYCGEYGSQGGRPHFHVLLFNCSFVDKEVVITDDGCRVTTSKQLQDLWSDDEGKPLGFVQIGEVTFESCSYVARYVLKKIDTMSPEERYRYLKGLSDGTIDDDEYVGMSRRPGVGFGWIQKYFDDVYNQDFVLTRDRYKIRPPKYYDSQLNLQNPERYDILSRKRKEAYDKTVVDFKQLERKSRYWAKIVKKLRRSYDEKSV